VQNGGFFRKVAEIAAERHVGPETRRGEERGAGFKISDFKF
jgi:hypothetical protein